MAPLTHEQPPRFALSQGRQNSCWDEGEDEVETDVTMALGFWQTEFFEPYGLKTRPSAWHAWILPLAKTFLATGPGAENELNPDMSAIYGTADPLRLRARTLDVVAEFPQRTLLSPLAILH